MFHVSCFSSADVLLVLFFQPDGSQGLDGMTREFGIGAAGLLTCVT
jgi:hypothetical protein